jgi:hypothetical protein
MKLSGSNVGTVVIFNINDPLRAAMSLRSLAADIGARTDLIPTYEDQDVFGVAGKQTLSLVLPARPVWVRVEDQSFTAELQRELDSPGSSESLTAIVVLNRALSIDELAKLMESGVRVLQRIPPRILRIAGEPYADWIGESSRPTSSAVMNASRRWISTACGTSAVLMMSTGGTWMRLVSRSNGLKRVSR